MAMMPIQAYGVQLDPPELTEYAAQIGRESQGGPSYGEVSDVEGYLPESDGIGWEEPSEAGEAQSVSGDEFMQLGVVEYGGRVETWYSSQVLYHYMTPEWTLDGEGFYRDSEGRYVVAASDVPYGSVIETSRGQAVVLDCGCPDGYTDFYVNWI